MLAAQLIALLLAFATSPEPPKLVEVRHVGVDYHFRGPMPKWSGGAFLTVLHGAGLFPEISAYGRDGRRFLRTIFQIPEAGNIRISAVAHAPGGSIAVTGSAIDNSDNGMRYLAVLSGDGKLSSLVSTGGFVAADVEFASDGTIWAVGWERTDDGHEKPEHMIVRRYSPSGKELAAFLPHSTVKRRPTYPHATTYSFLLSAHGRVGWYSNAAGEYIEFSNDGQITTRVADVPGGRPQIRSRWRFMR